MVWGPTSLLLIFILTACSTSMPTTNTTPNTTPTVNLGAQPCPSAVRAPSSWDPIIGTQKTVTSVESVTCASLIGTTSLQALVNVRSAGTGAILAVYIYNNISSANPTQLFKIQDLYKGDAKISTYNTILTGEVDASSSINKKQPNATLVQDLFREFQWSNSAGTFEQVSFPGIFPDLTRFQAETDQAQVNQGQQPWKLHADLTASALAVNMLKWYTSAQTTIVSGGGPHDANAIVSVSSSNPGSGTITITLSRLEGNTNGGIWEVIAVAAGTTASITAPLNRDILTSPVKVTGTGIAFEGSVGTLTVLDHLYTDIGHTHVHGPVGNGNTTFTTPVIYHSTFHTGTQEGLVVLYVYSNADGSIATAVMLKELLSA